MKFISRFYLLLIVLCFSGCAPKHVPSLLSSDHGYGLDEDEEKLIRQSDELVQEVGEKGLIYHDEEVQAYLDRVGNRLVPEAVAQTANLEFYVLRNSFVNAFALPNGSICLTVGLLARLENEAQLAQILGHEIAHVVLRHRLKQRRNRNYKAPLSLYADSVLLGMPVTRIPYVLSVASYSRESEEEADLMALKLISAAGYRLEEISRTFHIMEEVKSPDAVKDSVYSSHPSNEARKDYVSRLIQNGELDTNPQGRIGAAEYERIRKYIYLEAVKLKLLVKQYELALDLIDSELRKEPTSAWLHYYRGEACRGMGDDPRGAAREYALLHNEEFDETLVARMRARQEEHYEAATAAYQRTLQLDESFLLAYRGLGLVAYHRQDYHSAREALKIYVSGGNQIRDQRYINSILEEVKEK